MGRYDNEDYPGVSVARQKDFVLAMNEYCYVLNKTSGKITTRVGPTTITTSAQDALIVFNTKTKKFEEISDFEKAKKLFVSAPEGWYVILKNPAENGSHPPVGMSENPEIVVGKKVNISGPISFPLYAGQMAKVVRGHKLRSNQYLLARVYDADAAKESTSTMVDINGNEIEDKKNDYFVGQLMIIKGTEISFYIPPTGIEIIPQTPYGDDYVRDAVTLERLEYVILKDEDGEKRYVHGPAVVFPKPTETFTSSKKNSVIFRALELSPISGIYVKVIADYKDDNGTEHKTGEELFITGNDQMIYYPRPEHALIQYDGKYMHHAIAIPEGEGRYVLNRLTGEIKTIVGPAMYLPDPRTEVIVKRKLSERECALYYPGNKEVLAYNNSLSESTTEKLARSGKANAVTDAINCAYSTADVTKSLAIFEATANISRGVSYTKPRTITLDTKYEGVVSVDVWTGYAICVVSKTGERNVVVGPATRLLNYDETLQSIVTPEGETAFLKLRDNKIFDIIAAQTKDYVNVQIKLTYSSKFTGDKNKWFEINNYVDFIKDYMRNAIKLAVKNYGIQEFYADSTNIIRNVVLKNDEKEKKISFANNVVVNDVEITNIAVERTVADLMEKHQTEIIAKNLELADADAKMKVIAALAESDKKEAELNAATRLYKKALEQQISEDELTKQAEYQAKVQEINAAETHAKADLQKVLGEINDAQIAREKAKADAEAERLRTLAAIEAEKQKAYADTVANIMASIQPDLVAALTTKANSELLTEATKNMSAYAIAKGESVSDTVNTLLRGTSLEGILNKMTEKED